MRILMIFLVVIFGIIILFGLTVDLSAEESNFNFSSNSLFLYDNIFINSEKDYFSNEETFGNQYFSTGQRIGAGFLNIFGGLGSFLMADYKGGITILVADIVSLLVVSTGFATLGDSFFYYLAFPNKDDVDFLGTIIAYYTVSGIIYGGFSLIYGFIRPAIYKRSTIKSANLYDLRNWNIGLVHDEKGRLYGQIRSK